MDSFSCRLCFVNSLVPLILVLLFSAVTFGQTPPGFSPLSNNKLGVTFPKAEIAPGQTVPQTDTAVQPFLTTSAPAGQKFMVIMMDLDIPRAGALQAAPNATSTGNTTTLLHWFQPDLQSTSNGTLELPTRFTNGSVIAPILNAVPTGQAANSSETGKASNSSSAPATTETKPPPPAQPAVSSNSSGLTTNVAPQPGAEYLGPNPPPGQPPHRYTQLLFAQPDNFAVPPEFANINPPKDQGQSRLGFDVNKFMSQAGLQAPVASNFFLVDGNIVAGTPFAKK